MHIVLATAFFSETPWDVPGGGMGGYVAKFAKLLVEYGNEVEIVAGALNNQIWDYEGIKVYNAFWYGNLYGNSFQIAIAIARRNVAIQKCIREINKKNRVDIVQYAGWSGVGLFHSINCPSILRLSTYSKYTYFQNDSFKKYVGAYSFWERMAGRFVDKVICPGRIVADVFSRDAKRTVTVVETPIYLNKVNYDMRAYSELSNEPYILFFGTASKEKGFDTIGDMIQKLFLTNKDIRFVFAGWDDRKNGNSAVNALREKLGSFSNRFVYLGPLPRNSLIPVIKGAKAVLVPSLADNLPNACLEALSLGQIVVGTRGTALEQLICDGENGFLSNPGDPDDLLAAIKRVVNMSSEERAVMEKKAIESLEPYRPEKCIAKYMEIYRYEIQKRKRR